MKQALLALLLFLAPACAVARSTENEPLAPERLAKLTPGTSTAKDVVALLGAPADVVQLGKRSAYLYRYTATKRTGLWLVVVGLYNADTRSDRAWVFFDENQVLTHAGTTLAGDEVEYALPFEDVHD
jgi:outer membrane protein assembly factor BamE (lipoprotein component of BamABCDE complex)